MNYQKFTYTKRRLIAGLSGLGLVVLGKPIIGQARTPKLPECYYRQKTQLGSYSIRVEKMPSLEGRKIDGLVHQELMTHPEAVELASGYGTKIPFKPSSRPDSGFDLYFVRSLNLEPDREPTGLGWDSINFVFQNLYRKPEDGQVAEFLESGRVIISTDHGQVFFDELRDFREAPAGKKKKGKALSSHTISSEDGIDVKRLNQWLLYPSSTNVLNLTLLDPKNRQRLLNARYKKLDFSRLNRVVLDTSRRFEKDFLNEYCGSQLDSAPCFLTTACCEIIGLSDQAWELRTLRKFRDHWLKNQTRGISDIAAYYKAAPQVVARVNARSDARQIWLSHYARHILPAAVFAKIGARHMARRVYSKMMREMLAI